MKNCRIATTVMVLALCLLPEGVAAGEIVWTPPWTQWTYWIVRSPMVQPVVDHQGSKIGEEKIGDYFTRFRILSVGHSPGGRTAKLEIRWNENNAYAYEDNPEHVEIVIDLLDLTVHEMTQHGINARGVEFSIPWRAPRDQLGKLPFCWLWVDALPGATASLPLVEVKTTSPGSFLVKSRSADSAWPFQQVVDVRGGAAFVTIELGSCTSERMRLRSDSTWYDVVDANGAVIREVVEVGQQ